MKAHLLYFVAVTDLMNTYLHNYSFVISGKKTITMSSDDVSMCAFIKSVTATEYNKWDFVVIITFGVKSYLFVVFLDYYELKNYVHKLKYTFWKKKPWLLVKYR